MVHNDNENDVEAFIGTAFPRSVRLASITFKRRATRGEGGEPVQALGGWSFLGSLPNLTLLSRGGVASVVLHGDDLCEEE